MIFVAVENEIIIGFIGLQICLSFEITGKIMRIIALAVASAFQDQGVGGILIHKAEQYANQHDIGTILVDSGLKRKEAHQFYEKKSFYKKGIAFVNA